MKSKIKIPLVDLKAQYKAIKTEIDKAIKGVIDKTDFIMGEELIEFEKAFANYIGAKHAIGVSSGTDALHLSLFALGIQTDDEVIVPSYTFTATAEIIVWLGAKPVFAEINERSYTIDPKRIEKLITKKTKAIIPVHLYGHPADLDPILEIAKKNNLFLVEDAAQAHGAMIRIQNSEFRIQKKNEAEISKGLWRKVGSIGNIGIFSFYPGKNLGAYGDAGMVVTNDDKLAEKIKLLRNHGRTEKYVHEIVGFGNRLDTIQAAILLAKLPHLNNWNKKRRKNAAIYSQILIKMDEIILQFEAPWANSVYHLYVVRVKERDKLKEFLKQKGIDCGIHYSLPLHLQPAYRNLGYKKGDLPITEKIASEVLSLPLYPELTKNQIKYICQCIKDFYF